MELVHQRCAGIDIGKQFALVTVRIAGAGRRKVEVSTRRYEARTPAILALREDLIAAGVTGVVMESTGQYWKPFYYALEGAGFELVLGNAHDIRNMPGRKSDVSDSRWLAELGAHGLVRPSFVPEPAVRVLRDLTRDRSATLRLRAKVLTRIHEVLEDAGIKLTSVASDLNGVSSRAILDAMIAGERDPLALATLARGRLKAKQATLVEALTGRVEQIHTFRLQELLGQADQLQASADRYTEAIDAALGPYRPFRDLITTVPGISTIAADVISAETGADMTQFPTPNQLCSWAGVAPGSNESAGVVHQARTGHGNKHLQSVLGIAAMSVARGRSTYLSARHHRIAARRGRMRALVATQHKILEIIWHMATTNTPYRDLGGDYFLKRDPARATRRALTQLHHLGYDVTLTPTAS
ncbi:MAG: IS110 family transposase [Aquihabitans sp.]